VALEDRVKELEEELKVLKNEIQTTLLDIQEQILSHYYPSLYPSANKEANLAQANAANRQTTAEAYTPQPAAMPVVPTTAVPPAAVTPTEASPAPARYHGKYKTQTITLVDAPEEEEEVDDDIPFEEEEEPVRLAVVPQKSHKPAKPSVNGHTSNGTHKPILPPPSQELTAEDEAFLDAIVAKGKDTTGKEKAVSFDEFKELMEQKSPEGGAEEELLDEDLLNDLLQDSLFAFNEEYLNQVTNLGLPDLPEDETVPESASIDKLAVKSTVRKLLNWIDESVMVIGKDPTKQAIAMYVRAGDLSSEMHQTLLLLVDSTHANPATEKANIRQIIDTLGELNDILDHHTSEYLDQVMRFVTEVNFG